MEAIGAGPARRQRITAEIMERTGIDEAMIVRLVHGFYAKVRADAVLGPIFDTPSKRAYGKPLGPGALAELPASSSHEAEVYAIGGLAVFGEISYVAATLK